MPGIRRGNPKAEELGDLWQILREKAGPTQTGVARVTGVSQSTLVRSERGQYLPESGAALRPVGERFGLGC